MDIKTEKAYKISRYVLPIISFVILCIMFINEDSSWITAALILSAIVFGLSFPSTWMSKKIYKFGSELESTFAKVSYYLLFLPILEFILFYLSYLLILFLGDKFIITKNNDLATALSQAFTVLFFVFVATVCIILPHIQAMVVIVIKRFLKEKIIKKIRGLI